MEQILQLNHRWQIKQSLHNKVCPMGHPMSLHHIRNEMSPLVVMSFQCGSLDKKKAPSTPKWINLSPSSLLVNPTYWLRDWLMTKVKLFALSLNMLKSAEEIIFFPCLQEIYKNWRLIINNSPIFYTLKRKP